jgi:hypothetical protein
MASREIPLLKPDGTMDECSVGIIQACMQFPDDVASIEDEIAAYRQRSATGFRDTELGRYQQNSWRAAQLGGLCAGSMLYTICMFKKHRPEMGVGMNKSAVAVTLELERHGRKIGKNESTIKKYWSEYKNAAHLWAALMVEFRNQGLKLPVDFMKLLNVAEGLINCGNTVVEDWKPWRAPSSILTVTTTVEIPEPDAEDIAIVERYRANGQHLTN